MVPIFRLGSVSESVGSVVLDGVGIIGDAIGITDTQSITTTGTTPGPERFITGAPSTGVEEGAAGFTTAPAQRPGLSTETGRRLEDMPNPAVRAASARVPSAATDKADRPGAFRHAEAPASLVAGRVAAVEEHVALEERVVAAEGVVAETGVVDRSFVMFLVRKI